MIAPNACVFCGTRCAEDQPPICSACHADLPWIRHACRLCASPLPSSLAEDVPCADCQLQPPPFVAAAAALDYAFPVDAAIKALKFRRKLYYIPALVHTLELAIQRLPGGIDALLPVPLHWRRHAMRGFNQAAELSKPLCRTTGVPLIDNVARCRATPYQSSLAAKQRRTNLQSAFAVRGRINARHVLIIDDVITTGETCRSLAAALLRAGVEEVSALAVARA